MCQNLAASNFFLKSWRWWSTHDCEMVNLHDTFWMIPNLLPSWLGLMNTLTAPLQMGKIPPTPTCVLNMTLNNLMVRFQWCWSFWNAEHSFIAITPGPLWPGVVAPDGALSMVQIELNCILMLNWIVWIKTVELNWIAWNTNIFDN